MKFRSPLLTLSTLAVALASFALLVVAPPKAFDTRITANAPFDGPQGSSTETRS